jgi:hypothetical protein
MGTRSSHAGPGGHIDPTRPNRRSTHTRMLTGQRLNDVLCVCADRRQFNRATRRVTMSLLRRHARAMKVDVVGAVEMFKGVTLQNDSAAGVQGRLLAFAGQM